MRPPAPSSASDRASVKDSRVATSCGIGCSLSGGATSFVNDTEKAMMNHERKTLIAAAVVAFVAGGMLAAPNAGHAFNDNNSAQDEKEMIRIGLDVAASTGIRLDMRNKDSDMVGLGSYIVNVAVDCNGCHTR